MTAEMEALVRSRFEGVFEPELFEELLEKGSIQHFKEGEIVIDVNQMITQVPLMLEGSIKIMREDDEGREMFLYYIETGSACAASLTCCMNDHKSNILAIVEEDATFIGFPVKYMDEWMSKYRSWRSYILGNYAARYEEILDVVDLLAFKKMDDRVANYLKEKAIMHQTNEVLISHQDIAYDLNTSREVVSRILKGMERNGDVELKRGKIILNDK
ncbi:MAG: Crp/Fnr family transcriptional regulator [Crocinitomicaceae bacterium]